MNRRWTTDALGKSARTMTAHTTERAGEYSADEGACAEALLRHQPCRQASHRRPAPDTPRRMNDPARFLLRSYRPALGDIRRKLFACGRLLKPNLSLPWPSRSPA